VAPLTLKRASASRPSGQWRDDDYDVLRERHRHWSHLIFTRRAAGPPLDVGERTFGDNSSASGARLRADARGRDGSVREELETRMMIKSPLPESVALLEKVHECLGPNRLPLLIAIDGADGVGKLDRIGELRRRMPIAARLPLTMTRALRIVARHVRDVGRALIRR
jgi:hypothetical protein